MSLHASVEEASRILTAFGFDAERSNERSALTLLALLRLRPGEVWSRASGRTYGTRALMDWMADPWGKPYKANTREMIRRRTLHQLADAGFIQQNTDNPARPINSPRWNYRVSPAALEIIRAWGTAEADELLERYLEDLPGQLATYAVERALARIPVTLPDGSAVTLSPGGQNVLLKAMVEEFCPRFTPGGKLLYLGDADAKLAIFAEDEFYTLGITFDRHGKMPDLVVYLEDRDWLVLMEAASTHGPVDSTRHAELKRLFSGVNSGLVYVSCFADRATMRSYLTTIAWETEAWCADAPDHLMHFNGSRFLGPYS